MSHIAKPRCKYIDKNQRVSWYMLPKENRKEEHRFAEVRCRKKNGHGENGSFCKNHAKLIIREALKQVVKEIKNEKTDL